MRVKAADGRSLGSAKWNRAWARALMTVTLLAASAGAAPFTDLGVTGPADSLFNRFGQNYVTPAARFVLTASDSSSSITGTFYSIDGGAAQAYSAPFGLPEGTHTISYYSTSASGASETPHNATFGVSQFESNAATGVGAPDNSFSGSVIASGTFVMDGAFGLSGGAIINGNVTAPSITLANNSQINGTQTLASNAANPTPFDLNAALANATAQNRNADIAAYLNNGVLTVNSGTTLTLEAGNYLLQGINLSGGSVQVNGRVGIFLQGPISMSGGAKINFRSGADTEDLVIFSSDNQGIKLTGGSDIGAYLYAPFEEFDLSGGFGFGGHAFVATYKVTGSGDAMFWSGHRVPIMTATPDAATNFAGAAQSQSAIVWSWTDNANNETGYRVLSGGSNLSGDLAVNATSWIQTGLAVNSQSGPLLAEAFNVNGVTDSNTASRYTLAAVPSSLATTSVSSTTVGLSWSANGNPAGTVYQLERSLSGGAFSLINSGTATTFGDSGLAASTSYAYRVRALNGDSIPTAYDSTGGLPVTTSPQDPPSGSGLTLAAAAQSPASILWSWTGSPGNADGYRVKAGTVNVSGDLPSGAGSWTQTGLSSNTAYGPYVVEAYNSGGTGDSNAVTRYTLAAVPDQLTVLSLSSAALTLAWSPNGNPAPTPYTLRKQCVSGFPTTVNVSTATTFCDLALSSSTLYFYQVQAFNGDGIPTDFSPAVSTSTLPSIEIAAAASSLDAVRLYPNPFRPNGGNPDQGRSFSSGDANSGIIFENLTQSIKIRIYNVTGQLVTELDSDATAGRVQWDVKNGSGREVASGHYIAVLSSPGQKNAVKHILIIR